MNIGVLVDNDFNNDIRVRKEVDILKKNGYNVNVLCFAFDKKHYPDIKGVNIVRIKIKRSVKNLLFFFNNRLPLYDILWQQKIKAFILDNSIDIMHVHDLYMAKPAHKGISLTKKEIPIILDLHENYPEAVVAYNWTKGPLRKSLAKASAWQSKEAEYLRYATKIIVLSEFFKAELLTKYTFLQDKNIVVFPNIIDIKRFESFKIDLSIPKSKNVTLFYFGAVAERRGIFALLDAFEIVLNEGLAIDMIIIGPVDKADKARFLKSINSKRLKGLINYIPWIDISKLVAYMHVADIAVAPFIKNPQHESGVANKIYQYMFAGKPIIASDCRPQKELIEANNCGLIYSSLHDFAECIKRLVLDPDLRKRLGNNAKTSLYKLYDNTNYENLLIGLYQQQELVRYKGKYIAALNQPERPV